MCFLVEFGASVFIIDGSEPRLGINFFEKGQENWDFYVVKKEAFQGSGSDFFEGPGLGSRSIFKAQDQPGINFLGLNPSLVFIHIPTYYSLIYTCLVFIHWFI